MSQQQAARTTSVILLAGGIGTRMKALIPKQYLSLRGKPIAQYSFDLFLTIPEVLEVIVVCETRYQDLFKTTNASPNIKFAEPGPRRQDSLFKGLQQISQNSTLVCVHDSARPFITREMVLRVLQEGRVHGAATVGMPIRFTVKERTPEGFVKQTLDRSLIWEIQTPQVTTPELLRKGFEKALAHNIDVTDDVALVELLGRPVKLVEGSYGNLKITTPEDVAIAEKLYTPLS